eukprot:393911-Rhodomonas_salina.3
MRVLVFDFGAYRVSRRLASRSHHTRGQYRTPRRECVGHSRPAACVTPQGLAAAYASSVPDIA